MSKIKNTKRFFGGLNTDDNPSQMPDGDFSFARNVRSLSSDEQLGAGLAETMQSEVEIIIGAVADINYYGEAIGGNFQYAGYEEVTIGTQTWMKRNYDAQYPGSKAYDDNELNVPLYGRLYTHHQVMSSNFCPPGWRVPTEADIDTLLTYLGGAMIAGGKLKEAGEQDWATPNTGAVDSAGFRALPGGKFDLLFDLLGENSLMWLQDEAEPVAPVAIAATEVDVTSFLANWEAVVGADGYYLDVATDVDFTAFVAGFNNLDVGKVLSYPVTGLGVLTPYYYRLRAYNEIGSSENSNTITSTTLDGVVDEDGNVYTYVTIGSQQWLVENWKSTKYADGTPIPNLTLDADWIAEDGTPGHDGAYCYYDNNIAYNADYGKLYNWYAVDNAHGLAPAGWRVADWNDIDVLILYLVLSGDHPEYRLKETGLSRWDAPNFGATNESGFTAVGSGERLYQTNAPFVWFALFRQVTIIGLSTEFDVDNCGQFQLYYDDSGYSKFSGTKKRGFAIRMMRDIP